MNPKTWATYCGVLLAVISIAGIAYYAGKNSITSTEVTAISKVDTRTSHGSSPRGVSTKNRGKSRLSADSKRTSDPATITSVDQVRPVLEKLLAAEPTSSKIEKLTEFFESLDQAGLLEALQIMHSQSIATNSMEFRLLG